MTTDLSVGCVNSNTTSSTLELGTKCEERDIVVKERGVRLQAPTLEQQYSWHPGTCNSSLPYGNEGAFGMYWTLIIQKRPQPRERWQYGRNPRDCNNCTGSGAHGKEVRIDVGNDRTITTWWFGWVENRFALILFNPDDSQNQTCYGTGWWQVTATSHVSWDTNSTLRETGMRHRSHSYYPGWLRDSSQ